MSGIDEYTKLMLHMDGDQSSEIGGNDNYTKILCHMDTTPFVDDSSERYTITNTNVSVSTSTKKFGAGSGYFDQTAYLNFGNQSGLDITTDDFTIDCWVKIPTSGLGTDYLIICSKGSTGGYGYFFGVSPANGSIRWWSRNNGSWQDKGTSGIDLRDDSWHHVAVVKTGTSLKIYVDGTAYADKTLSGATIESSSSYDFYVGRNNAGWYFKGYIDEFRFSKGTQRWTENFTPYTTYYGGHIAFPHGSLKLDSATKKFGSSSVYFDGNSYIDLPDNSDWHFGSGEFTIDCWVRIGDKTTSQGIIDQYVDNNNRWMFWFGNSEGARFTIFSGGTKTVDFHEGGTGGWTNNTWYHLAVVRSGDNWTIYKDGTSVASTTDSDPVPDLAVDLTIGGHGVLGWEYWDGYIDELRISKGIARWTSNFTPPTSEHETDEYTKLLFHFSGDMSNSAHQLTFGSSSNRISVSPTKWNGSFYFGGSDGIVVPDSTDWDIFNNDFTIDVWVWLNLDSGNRGIVGQYEDSNSFWELLINASDDLVLYGQYGGSVKFNYSASPSLPLKTWTHLAVVRDGSTCRMFKNGTALSVTETTAWQTMTSLSATLNVGKTRTDRYFDGFMDEFRISKGIARWTSNFTSPTEPFNPYYISGEINYDGRIIVLRESDWSIVHNETYNAGSYIASGLGSSNVTALFRKSNGESQGYGNISPI